MRGRLLNMAAVGRAAGFLLVAVAMVAAVLRIAQDRHPPGKPAVVAPIASDPAARERARCQDLSVKGQDDAACEAAWAEVRRRFFGDNHAAPATPAKTGPVTPSQGARP